MSIYSQDSRRPYSLRCVRWKHLNSVYLITLIVNYVFLFARRTTTCSEVDVVFNLNI
jgi:hypothetical protein